MPRAGRSLRFPNGSSAGCHSAGNPFPAHPLAARYKQGTGRGEGHFYSIPAKDFQIAVRRYCRRSESAWALAELIRSTQREPLHSSYEAQPLHDSLRNQIAAIALVIQIPVKDGNRPAAPNVTKLPSESSQVSLCDRQGKAPNKPLKSARSRLALFEFVAGSLISDESNLSQLPTLENRGTVLAQPS